MAGAHRRGAEEGRGFIAEKEAREDFRADGQLYRPMDEVEPYQRAVAITRGEAAGA